MGEKAYGLSCIPSKWTLPFIVVSKELILEKKQNISNEWIINILAALERIGLTNNSDIIIRSSGCKEGLEERGQLYSCSNIVENLEVTLQTCLNKFIEDKDITDYKIPLVIQKYIPIYIEKGHLSNERRLRKDTRDWVIEVETTKQPSRNDTFGLRNWREVIALKEYEKVALFCNLEKKIKDILRLSAAWASYQKLRLHYEWVWDGTYVYIVQADKEVEKKGVNPKNILLDSSNVETFSTSLLLKINTTHSQKYPKIKNVFIYQELGLPIAPLYILEDQSALKELLLGKIDKRLEEDIKKLITKPLIIRMDMNSTSLENRQLLPRIEVRDYTSAVNWLKEVYSDFHTKYDDIDAIFIFHNFIPSVASAFAYATPNSRKVQISSLWGLPEGLYFNSHDKYVVDTKSRSVATLDIDKFYIDKKIYYKSSFVAADEKGSWHTYPLAQPYDWKLSIENENWIKQIALDSRRISHKEGKPLSIMWFVDVPEEICSMRVFPWHHENFDKDIIKKSKKHVYKTPFDKVYTIHTADDIEKLKEETRLKHSLIKRINIQPKEDKLLRNKHLLKDIGELALELNASILLEGSILSHAYYQLMQTGAIVEVVDPFDHFEDKQEFNKLVRDKVPENIEKGGEIVNVVKSSKESRLRALKDKLIEEAFEVLDANDDLIINEIADVYEVIDGILDELNITKETLFKVKKTKLDKAGGFKDSKILLDTDNPITTVENRDITKPQLFHIDNSTENLTEIDYKKLSSKPLKKHTDKRILDDSFQHIARITVPMIQDAWATQILELNLDDNNSAKLELKGKRIEASYEIELFVYTKKDKKTQLSFNFNNDK